MPARTQAPATARAATALAAPGASFLQARALFPDLYCWYILAGALDLMLTATIIEHLGGIEVNGLAHRIIEIAGLPGLIAFKFATVVVVVAICEFIGRRRPPAARRLAAWAVAISSLPVALALAQIAASLATGHLPL